MTKVEIVGNIGFSRYSDIVYWCTQCCPSYVTSDSGFDVEHNEVFHEFYFRDAQDATAFTLKWL